MGRDRYLIESGALLALADEYLALMASAKEARSRFAKAVGASDFHLRTVAATSGDGAHFKTLTGFRFPKALPPGWKTAPEFGDYAVPDEHDDAHGAAVLASLATLPPVPSLDALGEAIGFGSAMKVTLRGTAVGLSVENLLGETVLSVPRFSDDDIAARPELDWNPPSALMQIDELQYKQMVSDALAKQPKTRRRQNS